MQFFGGQTMDAALLLMPMTGFIAFGDPRMVRTVDAIREELCQNGFVRRYGPAAAGLPEPEGVFLACSFWLAECLSRQGRMKEVHEVFDRALSTGNELELFSEQFDPVTGELCGNFSQGLTHLSLISAAMALDRISVAWK
ncbi:glycoside hydrolase family 15 protein [Geobacter sp. SVR]|uniref:glycoside hydrolase family 15 protein n=1 Tax=Geobacter sp. SVR TaxID=2495594 RepID=UPI0015658A14|nr:glycoside hydrolase family 15 protein [Geobacter sp. SVR]